MTSTLVNGSIGLRKSGLSEPYFDIASSYVKRGNLDGRSSAPNRNVL